MRIIAISLCGLALAATPALGAGPPEDDQGDIVMTGSRAVRYHNVNEAHSDCIRARGTWNNRAGRLRCDNPRTQLRGMTVRRVDDRAANHDGERGQRMIVEDMNFDFGRRIDSGVARGTITGREAMTLRTELNALMRLDRTYHRDGLSRSERDTLMRRGAAFEHMIQRAENDGNR